MRRTTIVCAVALTGALSAAGVTACVAGADSVPPRAELARFACRQAPTARNRAVAITAVMRPVPATDRMALNFELQRRAPGNGVFTNVSGGDLGEWLYPTDPPTLGQQPADVWRLDKRVSNLAPGIYRYEVSFMWLAPGGRVLQTATRLSPHCDQR